MTAQEKAQDNKNATMTIAKFVACNAVFASIALAAIGLGAGLARADAGYPMSANATVTATA